MRRKIRIVLVLSLLALFGAGGAYYWWHQSIYPSTENAYVGGNVIRVAPLVNGKVTRLYAIDNQYVRLGQPLLSLDKDPFNLAVNEARNTFDSAAETVGNNADDIEKAANDVATAYDELQTAMESFNFAASRYNRMVAVPDQAGQAKEDLDDALADVKTKRNRLTRAIDSLDLARKDITRTGVSYDRLRSATTKLHGALLDRNRADLYAEKSGWLANVELRPGNVLQTGQPIFALVEDGDRWIDANFKETEFDRLRVGQPVKIAVDMYPEVKLDGTVESFSGGSGAVFSAIPPENATGNWVKVTQRFTVRISVDNYPHGKDRPLRIGSSVHVTVDTSGVDKE